MAFSAIKCTQCCANIDIDKIGETGICPYCKTCFISDANPNRNENTKIKPRKEAVENSEIAKKAVQILQDDSLVVKRLKEKLNACGGVAEMQMLQGKDIEIYYADDKTGIIPKSYKALTCEWKTFDDIVTKANLLGGTMYRGDSAAQNGAKIGSAELPLDTIDSFISIKHYGNRVGNSTLRRSTYFSAILAWAEIVENFRSRGKGGYIVVKPEFKNYSK